MKKQLSILALVIISSAAMAYDAQKAAMFHGFYKNFTQKACAESTLFLSAEEAMKRVGDTQGTLFLDVRTPAERSVVGLNIPGSTAIPLEHLFKAENLDRLPTEKNIIIVCHSGTRAVMAATALKMIGFKKIQVLAGGISALAAANTPKTAPMR